MLNAHVRTRPDDPAPCQRSTVNECQASLSLVEVTTMLGPLELDPRILVHARTRIRELR